jgi:arylsulfatase A
MIKLLIPVLALFLFSCQATSSTKNPNKKPNVVFILVDDLGWTDLACFGSKYYDTPNLDKLCSQGMKFTNAYAAAAICSPTRAACMTGKYPARIGITDWIRARFQGGKVPADKKNPSGYVLNKRANLNIARNPLWMEHEEETIAELLKPQGYTTCFIGKWHLGTPEWFPETQGFDYNFGGCDLGQPPSYFDPYVSKRNNPLYIIPNLKPRKKGEYLTDREGYEAAEFIKKHKEKPFFLYLCNYAVHTPIQGQKHLIEKYNKKTKTNQKSASYAAMVEAVDNTVGKIMRTLKEEGIADNTLIVFTGDNGGLMGPTNNAPLRSGKGFPYEGGIREPFIVRWPGKVKAGTVNETAVCSIDILPTIVEATGAMSPKTEIDGVSLVAELKQVGKLPERPLIWHFPHFRGKIPPYSIIRYKGWKLIKYELFHLDKDLSEKNELSKSNMAKVKELETTMTKMLVNMKALIPHTPK